MLCHAFYNPALQELLAQLLIDWHAVSPSKLEPILESANYKARQMVGSRRIDAAVAAAASADGTKSQDPARGPAAAAARTGSRGEGQSSAPAPAPAPPAASPMDELLQSPPLQSFPGLSALSWAPCNTIMHVPVNCREFTYFRALFVHLLKTRGMLCIGLYRQVTEDMPEAFRVRVHGSFTDVGAMPATDAVTAYVNTNPDPLAPLLPGDEAIVLLAL